MDKRPTRKYQLCVDQLKTFEDIKKILDSMKIRIRTDDPLYEELKEYFKLEVVPKGYFLLMKKIGQDGISKLGYDEIEEKSSKLLSELKEK